MAERIILSDLIRNGRLAAGNRLRLLRHRDLDYVVFCLSGQYVERVDLKSLLN